MAKTSVIFLGIPSSLKDLEESFGGAKFIFSLTIPLPVEFDANEEKMSLEKISLEMIISGMLRIISAAGKNNSMENLVDFHGTEIKSGDIIEIDTAGNCGVPGIPPEWLDYYRSFIFTSRPEIFHQLTGASIVKAKNGEFDIALEINSILEGLIPGSPGVLLNKALILENRAKAAEKNGSDAVKENSEAEKAFEEALSMEPVLPDSLFNAAYFYMRLGDYRQAREYFSRYIANGKETEIPEEKKAEAQKIINTIKTQGLDDDSYLEAYKLINRGNNETGLLKIREYIGNHPKVWNGWFLLGWTLRKLARFKDALEAFKKAEELGGSGSDLKNEVAICLMELGDNKAARKELEAAIREEPENIKSLSNLGVLALRAGNREEAEAFFRTVLEIDPGDPLAKHFLENN